ncbi:unnamed protein product [Gadus morhua 'NCC']
MTLLRLLATTSFKSVVALPRLSSMRGSSITCGTVGCLGKCLCTNLRHLHEGKCIFKKLPNGNLNKTKVVRVPLRYPVVQGKSSARQTTMFECNRGKPVSTALSAKPTNLAQWIATSCRPISVVEDDGLELVLQAATASELQWKPMPKPCPICSNVSSNIIKLYKIYWQKCVE